MSNSETTTKSEYQPPALQVLGSLHSMTLLQDKQYGQSDGFTFMGVSISNASP